MLSNQEEFALMIHGKQGTQKGAGGFASSYCMVGLEPLVSQGDEISGGLSSKPPQHLGTISIFGKVTWQNWFPIGLSPHYNYLLPLLKTCGIHFGFGLSCCCYSNLIKMPSFAFHQNNPKLQLNYPSSFSFLGYKFDYANSLSIQPVACLVCQLLHMSQVS